MFSLLHSGKHPLSQVAPGICSPRASPCPFHICAHVTNCRKQAFLWAQRAPGVPSILPVHVSLFMFPDCWAQWVSYPCQSPAAIRTVRSHSLGCCICSPNLCWLSHCCYMGLSGLLQQTASFSASSTIPTKPETTALPFLLSHSLVKGKVSPMIMPIWRKKWSLP